MADAQDCAARQMSRCLPGLLDEAKQLGINISDACEAGLSERVAQIKRELWLAENREAIDHYNSRIERDGLTLARYRRFG